MNARHETVYFTDRDLGHRFADKLKAAGIKVERHDSHFEQMTTDPEWIGEIGRRGWVALTRDARIHYSPLAVETLMNSGARLLVIVGRMTTDEAAELFIRHRSKIQRLLKNETKPFIGKIRRDGVLMWKRWRDWNRRAKSKARSAGNRV